MGKVKFTTRSSTKSPLNEIKRNHPKAWTRIREKEEKTQLFSTSSLRSTVLYFWLCRIFFVHFQILIKLSEKPKT